MHALKNAKIHRVGKNMHGFEREKKGFARGAHEGLEFVGRAVGEAVKTAWGPADRRCP